MRLNRFLAAAGLGSRRSCEELIQTSQITINGVLCNALATQVEPTDVVKVGNRVLRPALPMTILLNKPAGYLCTASDTHDRQTVFDLLPQNFPRLFHVGRLDKESEGLLILTNDGDLALKLTHPRYKVEKEYEVVLDHPFDFDLSEKMIHGISTPEGWAKAESIFRLGSTKVKVVLRQGLKRQIRHMFFALGYEVKRLIRVRIGPISIESMPAGSCRALTHKEIDSLLASGKPTGEAKDTEPKPPRKPYRSGANDRSGRSSEKRPSRPAPRRPYSERPSRERVEEIPFAPRSSRKEGREFRIDHDAAGKEASEGRPQRREEGPRSGGFARKPSERHDDRPRRSPYAGKSEGRPERKFGAKPSSKPYGAKPEGKSFGRKPSVGKAGGKPVGHKPAKAPTRTGPHPFAIFQRRKPE